MTYVLVRFWMEATNKRKSGIVGIWFGIFAIMAIVLGGLEHASEVDPSYVDTAHVAVRGVVQLQYRPDAPPRPWPNTFGTWGGPPLSAADPDQFRKYFEPLLARLDAAGVTLSGFEPGKEINSPMFNSDFGMPAENPAHPREFNVADLAHDPEAQQVAGDLCNMSSCLRSSRMCVPGQNSTSRR